MEDDGGKPLQPDQLMRIAKILEGMSYHITVNSPPNFSVIRFYDQVSQRDWGIIKLPFYFEKDLEAVARHHIRFLRAYGVEIYRTECIEKQRSLQKELDS